MNPTLKLTYQKIVPQLEGDLGVTRQWTDNWTVNPVTDPGDLRRLRVVYRNETGFYVKHPNVNMGDEWQQAGSNVVVTQTQTTESGTVISGKGQGPSTFERDVAPDAKETQKITTTTQPVTTQTTRQTNPTIQPPKPVTTKLYTTTRPGKGEYLTGSYGKTTIYVSKMDPIAMDRLSQLVLETSKSAPATKQSSMFQLQFHQPLLNP